MTDEERIAQLESTVQNLTAQISVLSADLQITQDDLHALDESKADISAVKEMRLQVDRLAINSAGLDQAAVR